MTTFSKRNNYSAVEQSISIREDAPIGLREFLVQTMYALGYQPSSIRKIFCRVLRKSPDSSNWSEYPNIDYEVRQLIEECSWFKVYDIIEAVHADTNRKSDFSEEINDFFKEQGIGWKLEGGQVLFRGDETFEVDLKKAETVLADAHLHTARTEIKEAIRDLSRKPHPDITGAVQHGVACLECVAREAIGGSNSTLGELIRRNRNIVPPPLDKVVEGIWGFSSEQGRHLKEGREPELAEAELLVGLSASISTYLASKTAEFKKSQQQNNLF